MGATIRQTYTESGVTLTVIVEMPSDKANGYAYERFGPVAAAAREFMDGFKPEPGMLSVDEARQSGGIDSLLARHGVERAPDAESSEPDEPETCPHCTHADHEGRACGYALNGNVCVCTVQPIVNPAPYIPPSGPEFATTKAPNAEGYACKHCGRSGVGMHTRDCPAR